MINSIKFNTNDIYKIVMTGKIILVLIGGFIGFYLVLI